MNKNVHSSAIRSRGMTLIELLIAMVIGLVLTLAVTSIVIFGESQKRTTTSTNDMGQSGAYAAYVVDRAVRSAGSGFSQSWNLGAFGCRLSASSILPRLTAFPPPFAAFLGGAGAAQSGNLRLAPVLIAKNQSAAGSDVLVVMGGNGAAGDVPRPIRGLIDTDKLRVENTVGLASGDIALITQSGTEDCLFEQINVADAATFKAVGNEVVPLGGSYFTSTGSSTSLATLAGSGAAFASTLGNASAGNVQFQLIGVGANRTLFSYDLLRSAGAGTDADALQSLADGVAELHALYGLDTDNNGTVDTWVAPDATGYDIATVMTTPATMRQIAAVRVALVMRSSNFEKEVVSPPTLTLFGDLATALQHTVTLTGGDDPHYRYRVIDTTIPLRNILLLPTS